MARTRQKSEYMVRSVRSKEDRRRPSVFMRLKTDESFRAYALFEPDPGLEDNPGYYEYYDHWDAQGNQYVPCAGERCPFCTANLNPSTRALTAWYFPEAGDVKDQIKLFTMNFGTINDTSDESEEEDGILGKQLRIKRLSDKGDYKVKVTTASKPLTKAQLKKAMALLEERFDSMNIETLQDHVNRTLKAQMERLKALDALEDDDDEDDEDEVDVPKARRGKPKAEIAEEEDEDDEDEEEDEDETDDEESEDEDEEDEDEDETEDEDEEEEDEDEEDEDEEEDEQTEISGGVYEVVKTDERNEKFDLKNDDGKITVWLGQGIDVDYDEIAKGVSVVIDAQLDAEGDWVITAIDLEEKPKPRRKTTTRRRAS